MEESNASKEMKYEGLAALIIEGQRHAKERHDDFVKFVDHRFTGLEEHNKRQNGAINENLKAIADLQRESNERKLTCGAAVEILKAETKYAKFVHWIDKHGVISGLLFFGMLLVSAGIIDLFSQKGWLGTIWHLITKT